MLDLPQTMRAIRIERFGGPEAVRVAQIEVPKPGPDELLLEVQAASVNPMDCQICVGGNALVTEDMLPYTLGRDVCGKVVERGRAVTNFADGDSVYALLGPDRGSYAEYVVVRKGEAALRPRLPHPAVAAAVPLAGLTAWQGLFRHGALRFGQRVLIHAGAGGVGHFALQFAKIKGAYVTATVSAEKAALARRLGADEVIDYTTRRFDGIECSFDLVLDLVGGETQERSWALLKRGGILVSTQTTPSPAKARAQGAHGIRFSAEPDAAELTTIAQLIDAGEVRPVVSQVFRLKDVVDALEVVRSGHAVGKIVLTAIGRNQT